MKRILALICVAILLLSIVALIVAAFTDSPNSGKLFAAAIATNIILPVMMWVILRTTDYLRKKGEAIREESNNK